MSECGPNCPCGAHQKPLHLEGKKKPEAKPLPKVIQRLRKYK